MRFSLLAASALALAPLSYAYAGTLFDSIDVPNPNSSLDGVPDGTVAIADSFTASNLGYSTATLQVSAADPSDGGSAMVYLVPDTGAGSPGIAASPTVSTSGSPAYNNGFTFAGAQLIGSILDSSLAATTLGTTLVSFSFTPTITSPNSEYWIGIVGSAASSAMWSFEASGAGVGLANQANYFYYTTSNGFAAGLDPDIGGNGGGPYGLIVETPEPMSIAILGAALTGLGVVRRRNKKSAA